MRLIHRLVYLLVCAALLLSARGFQDNKDATKDDDATPNEYLVRLRQGVAPETVLDNLAPGSKHRPLGNLNLHLLELPPDTPPRVIETLAKNPLGGLCRAEPDPRLELRGAERSELLELPMGAAGGSRRGCLAAPAQSLSQRIDCRGQTAHGSRARYGRRLHPSGLHERRGHFHRLGTGRATILRGQPDISSSPRYSRRPASGRTTTATGRTSRASSEPRQTTAWALPGWATRCG